MVPLSWKLGQKRITHCAMPCSMRCAMRFALCNVLCNALQHVAKIRNKFSFLWKVRKKVLILVKNENFFLIFVKNEKKSSHFREKWENQFSISWKMRKKFSILWKMSQKGLLFVKNYPKMCLFCEKLEKKVLIFAKNEKTSSHFREKWEKNSQFREKWAKKIVSHVPHFSVELISVWLLGGNGNSNVRPLWSKFNTLQFYSIWRNYATHLQFGPRTSFWFRQCQVLVFRKMSILIHLNFSPLAGIFFLLTIWWNYITWLRLCLLKSLLTMIQHMHCLLVFRKMSSRIHLNFSSLAGIFFLLTKWWNYITWTR